MNDDTRLTRRRMLAGAGTLGAVGAASGAMVALTEPAVAYTDTARIRSGSGAPIEVDWRETYNGQVVEDTLEGDGEPPIVSIGNVLPGDRGAVATRVRLAEDGESDPQPSRIEFALRITDAAENGITEPEAAAGDDTEAVGELPEHVTATVWYDVGALDVEQAGACNADREPAEPRIANGSFAAVAGELADGIVLRPGGDGGTCFGPDASVCLGLRWSLPSSVGNVVQSDSMRFEFAFRSEPCES